jgi:hypothetical protein
MKAEKSATGATEMEGGRGLGRHSQQPTAIGNNTWLHILLITVKTVVGCSCLLVARN